MKCNARYNSPIETVTPDAEDITESPTRDRNRAKLTLGFDASVPAPELRRHITLWPESALARPEMPLPFGRIPAPQVFRPVLCDPLDGRFPGLVKRLR